MDNIILYAKELGETRTLDFLSIISTADTAFLKESREDKSLD